MDTLKSFRQLHSIAAGHPENEFPGIEVTTGPLGQGIANAVGLAMAEAHLAATYNKEGLPIVDHYTYTFCGDGCLMEGVSGEASSVAGHLGLGKLIVLYDSNKITIDGDTDLAFSEDVVKRYESYGWHTLTVENGDTDIAAISEAIKQAKAVTDKPTLIKVTTTIGFGSTMAGTASVHGSPLGNENIKKLKTAFGLNPEESFVVPEDVYKTLDATEKGKNLEDSWNALFAKYEAQYPTEAAEFKRRQAGELPAGWDAEGALPVYSSEAAVSTRKASGLILNHFSKTIPELFGGSADLNPSCFTYLDDSKDFQKGSYENRNIRFGVREHAMAAICNGLAAYGGIIPFCSTFLNFIGYAYGATILSALSKAGVLYVFTHDSIFLGEDGPTHQPIEKYANARATPNTHFIRPADYRETVAAYVSAIQSRTTPTVMSLSRQNLPILAGSTVEGALKGGYIVKDVEGTPDLILIGTGSEVSLCIDAAAKIDAKVRVVSFPCWELFDKNPLEYRLSVLPSGVPVLSVEAAATFGWDKYAHASIGIDVFGASAPGGPLAKEFGFTVDNVVAKSTKVIDFYKGKNVTSKLEVPF
eukprot:TRINITY_DN11409_c0_g1_i1.p1 TRINITY_DN11409_c0_g1~~TRINITY_DN11409_c0_g1_i1.p1  ORF type:complete len:673 (-),score=190.73 TRINITY_DN11409_c0_g1_i1:39-1796(-)